MMKKM